MWNLLNGETHQSSCALLNAGDGVDECDHDDDDGCIDVDDDGKGPVAEGVKVITSLKNKSKPGAIKIKINHDSWT